MTNRFVSAGKVPISFVFANFFGEELRRAPHRPRRKRLGISLGRWSAAKQRNRTACALARASLAPRCQAQSRPAKCSPLPCNSFPPAHPAPPANSPLPSTLPSFAQDSLLSRPADAPALPPKLAQPYP